MLIDPLSSKKNKGHEEYTLVPARVPDHLIVPSFVEFSRQRAKNCLPACLPILSSLTTASAHLQNLIVVVVVVKLSFPPMHTHRSTVISAITSTSQHLHPLTPQILRYLPVPFPHAIHPISRIQRLSEMLNNHILCRRFIWDIYTWIHASRWFSSSYRQWQHVNNRLQFPSRDTYARKRNLFLVFLIWFGGLYPVSGEAFFFQLSVTFKQLINTQVQEMRSYPFFHSSVTGSSGIFWFEIYIGI